MAYIFWKVIININKDGDGKSISSELIMTMINFN